MSQCLVKKLANGLQVIVQQDVDAVRAACAVKINAGSFHEPTQWPGLAHCLEHCLFLGSVGASEQFAQRIQRLGGRYNAKTLSSKTLYFADLPAAKLDTLLDALATLVSKPAFNMHSVQAESSILEAEYQARCSDEQQQRLNALFEQIHPAHYLRRFYAGCAKTLGNNIDDLVLSLKQWHAEHYVGQQMCLFIMGPQPVEAMLGAVELYFSELPAGRPIAPLPEIPLFRAQQKSQWLVLEQKTSALQVFWPFNLPESVNVQILLTLLNSILKQREETALFRRLSVYSIQDAEFSWVEAHGQQGLLQLTLKIQHELPQSVIAEITALCQDWLINISRDAQYWPEVKSIRAISEQVKIKQAIQPDFEQAALQLMQASLTHESIDGETIKASLAESVKSPLFVLSTQSTLTGDVQHTHWFPVAFQKRALPEIHMASNTTWPPYNVGHIWRRVNTASSEGSAIAFPGLSAHQLASWIYWPHLSTGQAEYYESMLVQHWQQHFHEGELWGAYYVALSRPQQLRFVVVAPREVLPELMAALWQVMAEVIKTPPNIYQSAQSSAPSSPWLLRRMLQLPLARWVEWPLAQSSEYVLDVTEVGQQAVLLRVLSPFHDAATEAAWRLLGAHWAHPFYQRLRVEQGLGYALFCRFERGEDAFEMQCALQSPHASVAVLQAAIRQFIMQAVRELPQLAPATLADLKTAAALALQENGKGPARFTRYCVAQWSQFPVAWDEQVLLSLQELSLESLQEKAQALCASAPWRWLLSDGTPR